MVVVTVAPMMPTVVMSMVSGMRGVRVAAVPMMVAVQCRRSKNAISTDIAIALIQVKTIDPKIGPMGAQT